MTNTQMQTRKIDWLKSSRQLALAVWGMATYIALLGGAIWLAVNLGGQRPAMVATVAVVFSSWLNWLVFMSIERRYNN
jgi:Na+/proline symporter